jgi:hypothetical protein
VEVSGYRLILGWPTVLTTLVILALLGYALRNPWLRSWRTVFAAILTMVLIMALLGMPLIPGLIIRGTVMAAFALAVLFGDRRLWSVRRVDGDFAVAWHKSVVRFPTLGRRIGSIPWAESVEEFAAIIDDLTNLAAPSDDWRQLRDDTVAELTARLNRLRSEEMPTDAETRSAEERWQALGAEYGRILNVKSSFWLPWP